MLFKLFLLFVIVPLAELTLLLWLTEVTSWTTTLGIVIVTGLVGSWLARRQGFRTFQRIRQELADRRMPTDSLVDALMIFVAGALLLTPGMLTDVFGLSLLVPMCRRYYRSRLKKWFQANFKVQGFYRAEVRDGESRVVDSFVVTNDPPTDDAPKLDP